MVALGFLMVALSAGCWWVIYKKYPHNWMRHLRWMVLAMILPYAANTAGWILTETARQPWVVHGLLLTKDAVSPNLSTAYVWVSLIAFIVIYSILMAADIFLLYKTGKNGLASDSMDLIPKNDEADLAS